MLKTRLLAPHITYDMHLICKISSTYLRCASLQAIDSDMDHGHHELSVSRGVLLTGDCGHDPYDARLFLGFINDDVVEALEMYAEGATEMLNEANNRKEACTSNCQDWCLTIVQSLEDARCLEKGTLEKAKRCPRTD